MRLFDKINFISPSRVVSGSQRGEAGYFYLEPQLQKLADEHEL